MRWMLIAIDKPDHVEVRAAARPAHVEWVLGSLDHVVRAGPLLSDDGETMKGTVIEAEFDDRAAVEAWAAQDPYLAADLFESVTITAWTELITRD